MVFAHFPDGGEIMACTATDDNDLGDIAERADTAGDALACALNDRGNLRQQKTDILRISLPIQLVAVVKRNVEPVDIVERLTKIITNKPCQRV